MDKLREALEGVQFENMGDLSPLNAAYVAKEIMLGVFDAALTAEAPAQSDKEVAWKIWHTFGARDKDTAVSGIAALLAHRTQAATGDDGGLREIVIGLIAAVDEFKRQANPGMSGKELSAFAAICHFTTRARIELATPAAGGGKK